MTAAIPPIAIIGAGLSGLTLGLCLKHKGIAAIIYDRATSSSRHNYGISLRSSTYRPLLPILQMDEATFKGRLAVNSYLGEHGSLAGADGAHQTESFHCNRGRLEALLGEGLSIERGKKLKSVRIGSGAEKIAAVFDDGSEIEAACLFGCEGPHSVTRQSLTSKMEPEVLPYVVFNGKRRVSSAEYTETVQEYMQDSVIIQTRSGDALLQVSINDVTASHVDLSYTYSRRARTESDPLHRPDRPKTGATDTPEEFYEELAALGDLQPPFRDMFNSAKVRDDRILHWLMRSLDPDVEVVQQLAGGSVVLIGDAVHATPILEGDGANTAIKDGIDFGEHISVHAVGAWNELLETKAAEWRKSVEDSKRRISEMHPHTKSSL